MSELAERFRAIYCRPPTAVAEAPGRVNLIGEHTDYNGLPVMPMAIDRTVEVAVAPRADSRIEIANLDPQYPAIDFELTAAIPPSPPGEWAGYVKAAAQGLFDVLGDDGGASLLVSGDIPAAAGLSSSAALVVASGLALLAAHGRENELGRVQLAERLAAAERYVGTMSGGMDQAISLLAEAGCALRIDFFPLRTRDVPLPANIAVVVCHSLVDAAKSGAARDGYNRRVVECRLAALALGDALGAGDLRRFGDLGQGEPLADFLPALAERVGDRPLTLAELASALDRDPEGIADAVELPRELVGERFPLVRRARHVLTEADRVAAAEHCLHEARLGDFGALLDDSHRSLRDDYEVSHPELDALVAAAKESGASGARLTGAGFGGAAIAVVPTDACGQFLAELDRRFYTPRRGVPGRGLSAMVESHRFVVRPSGAATLEPFAPGDGT